VPSKIKVRYADTTSEEAIRAEARALFGLLSVNCHQEVGVPETLAPFDPVKCLQSIVDAVRDGLVLMAYDGDELIGALGCMQYEVWYSPATMLAERFFYILPAYRDGEAFKGILEEAKAVADSLGVCISISIANMHKGRRPTRNGLQRVATQLTYLPQGNNYVIVPAGEDSNV
jgi:hypothetical protein